MAALLIGYTNIYKLIEHILPREHNNNTHMYSERLQIFYKCL